MIISRAEFKNPVFLQKKFDEFSVPSLPSRTPKLEKEAFKIEKEKESLKLEKDQPKSPPLKSKTDIWKFVFNTKFIQESKANRMKIFVKKIMPHLLAIFFTLFKSKSIMCAICILFVIVKIEF